MNERPEDEDRSHPRALLQRRKEVLREMMLNGMDVCRLNFSHGNYAFYVELIAHHP